MVLKRNHLLRHFLHLQSLVEFMLLHKVFLSWVAFPLVTGPWILSWCLFFIFSPNLTHFCYLLPIECVCFVAVFFVVLQRLRRDWCRVLHTRSLRFIVVSLHNLNLPTIPIHKWNALFHLFLFWLASKLVGNSKNWFFLIIFLGCPPPPLVLQPIELACILQEIRVWV